jgi:hypothetical protein
MPNLSTSTPSLAPSQTAPTPPEELAQVRPRVGPRSNRPCRRCRRNGQCRAPHAGTMKTKPQDDEPQIAEAVCGERCAWLGAEGDLSWCSGRAAASWSPSLARVSIAEAGSRQRHQIVARVADAKATMRGCHGGRDQEGEAQVWCAARKQQCPKLLTDAFVSSKGCRVEGRVHAVPSMAMIPIVLKLQNALRTVPMIFLSIK